MEFHDSRRKVCQTGENWKKRVWHKRDDMLKRMPEEAFPVAVDNASGGKKFTFFDTHEAFFRETAVDEQKNFYEMIKPNAWCRAYFDIEFYEEKEGGDGNIEEIIQTIEETMCSMWQAEMSNGGGRELRKEVLMASRQDLAAKRYKHSYHVIFPEIYCEGNNGRLKELVKALGENPKLQRKGKTGQPMCAIDKNVYSKWQNFRMVESCKKTEGWRPGRDVGTLRWREKGVQNMTRLLRTVITRVETGGVRVARREERLDVVTGARVLLQAMRVDGITATNTGLRAWGAGICPGSGERHVEECCSWQLARTGMGRKIECHQGRGCKPLVVGGDVKGLSGKRLWAGKAWEESEGLKETRKKLAMTNAKEGEGEQEEKWADFMTVEALCVMGAAARGWHTVYSEEECQKEETALMTPMTSGQALEDREEGERIRGTLQRYTNVVGIHQEPETGQWLWFRVSWDKKEVKWQTAGGALRRKTERNIVQWITGEEGGEEGWTLERRKGSLCSNPTNFGLLTWALLWYEDGRGVVVGEMVEILKMIARRNGRAQLPGEQINALMRELMNYGPIGEWERIAGLPREKIAGEGRGNETKKRKVQQGIKGSQKTSTK
jgi:hypothetical protein